MVQELLELLKEWLELWSNFDGVYSRNNLPKIKDKAYVTLDDYEVIRTHWITTYVNGYNVTC